MNPPNLKNNPPPASAGVFVSTIAAMNDGQVIRDLDDAVREATKATLLANSKSKVTLELTVIPAGTGAGDTPLIKITDKIKVMAPKPARDKAPLFFADENGNPTRRNPNQDELRLTSIEGTTLTQLPDSQAANQ